MEMHKKYSDDGTISLPMSVSDAGRKYSMESSIINSRSNNDTLCRYQGRVTLNGANIMHTALYVNGDHHINVPLETNYGIIGVFQSSFVACESVSCMTK